MFIIYNFRLKEFGNGTLQLVYYQNAVREKEDYWKPSYVPEIIPLECDDDGFDIPPKGFISPFSPLSPFFNENATQLATDDVVVLTEEELKEKQERSIASSVRRSVKMIYDYGRSNVWDWFFTLTFKPVESFNRENYLECSTKVRNWFKNIRKNYCPDLKYLIVPEQHKSGAWHFHALVSNCDELTFEKAVNNQEYRKDKETGDIMYNEKGQPIRNKYFGEYLRTRYPDGDYIYNIKQFKNGWSTATRIRDTRKAVSYIVKYITKDLCECTFGMRRYLPSNNLELPTVTTGVYAPDKINEILLDICYNYGAKLSIETVKNVSINVPGYANHITIYEFDTRGEKNELISCK